MTELSGFLALPSPFAVLPYRQLIGSPTRAHTRMPSPPDAARATGLYMPFRREERPAVKAPG